MKALIFRKRKTRIFAMQNQTNRGPSSTLQNQCKNMKISPNLARF
jgi:predicted nucleic acid binding AN1-type Zn finger protein